MLKRFYLRAGVVSMLLALITTMPGFMKTTLAQRAVLMGTRSFCSNQADSMDFQWISENTPGSQMFFLSGTNAEDRAITPIGHADAFNTFDQVDVAIHGGVAMVGNLTAANFAQVFLANHQTTPQTINMYVCRSNDVPPGQLSTIQTLAGSYPGAAAGTTRIGQINGPVADNLCALRASSGNKPFTMINELAQAQYRSGTMHINAHDGVLDALIEEWNDVNIVHYPGEPAQSFHAYCNAQIVLDPTGAAWAQDFQAAVNTQFDAAYLNLINTNSGGNNFTACGAARNCWEYYACLLHQEFNGSFV